MAALAELSHLVSSAVFSTWVRAGNSGIPPTVVATTGRPHASDSMMVLGHPSEWLGKQTKCAAFIH